MKITLNKGDKILTGKYKNKRDEIKTFGMDDKGQPTINGKKVLTFRMEKFMKKESINEGPQRQLEKYTDLTWKKLSLGERLLALQSVNATGSNQAMKLFNKTS